VKFPVSSPLMWTIILGSPLKYPHGNDKSITARMNLVNIGNAQILTIPGEALPNIGYYIKRHMKGDNNLLFGLTNDAFGYILTKVDFNSFKEKFNDAGVKQFGSGWAWLVRDKGGKLQITSSPNQDNPLSQGFYPIMGNDVWEHAYYLKYKNVRADYLNAWWNVVNWDEVTRRYQQARGGH